MTGFTQKYEVQKGRTVTCKMGVVHEGGKLELANFSGDDQEAKQKIIDSLVDIKALKAVPLTDAEKEAFAEAAKEAKAKEKREAEAKAKADKEAAELAEAEAKAKEKKEAAILSADFDSMNKDPMIEFAKEWEIELKETKADDIRAELNLLKESLKSL